MASINENRKLMVENMKKVKSQLNEDRTQLNEFEFWDWVVAGVGFGMGKTLLWFAVAFGLLIITGIKITASSILDKIDELKRDYKNKEGAKEALDFLTKNQTIREIQKLSKSLKDTNNTKVDKRTKGAESELLKLKNIQKELTSKRKTFALKLVDEIKSAKLSKEAVQYLSEEIPYIKQSSYFKQLR